MSYPRNIFAWTAPGAESPAYVSVNEQFGGAVTMDVREGGQGGSHVSVVIPREQLCVLLVDLQRYLLRPDVR